MATSFIELFRSISYHISSSSLSINTLIVLSADHGAAEVPAYLSTLGMKTELVAPKTWDKKPSMLVLKK